MLATWRHPFIWHCLLWRDAEPFPRVCGGKVWPGLSDGFGEAKRSTDGSELSLDLKLVLVSCFQGGGDRCVHWRCVALLRPHCHELKAICDF